MQIHIRNIASAWTVLDTNELLSNPSTFLFSIWCRISARNFLDPSPMQMKTKKPMNELRIWNAG